MLLSYIQDTPILSSWLAQDDDANYYLNILFPKQITDSLVLIYAIENCISTDSIHLIKYSYNDPSDQYSQFMPDR